MKKLILPVLVGLIVSAASYAVVSTQSSMTQFVDGSGLTKNVSPSTPLPVTGTSGGGAFLVNQGNAGASSWLVNLTQVGGSSISMGQKTGGSSIPVVIASDQSPIPVTGSFSIPGVATSTLQGVGNASLASLDSKLPPKGQATMALSLPVVLASDQSAVPVSMSSVPVGGATSALQSTGNALLSTIAGNSGLSTVNSGGSAVCGTVSTVISLSPPLGAVGFVLMNMDTSTLNVRWAVGSTATTAIGQQLQPGRSSDLVPVNSEVSLVSESGTQNYCIQWLIK